MLIDAEPLTDFASKIFLSLGATSERAATVASHLVEANLKGHDSHGVGMIPTYVYGAEKGYLKVNQDAVLAQDSGAVMLFDNNFGFGQVVGRQSTEQAIERARSHGMVCAGARNNYHLGRIGTYGELVAEAGLVSLHFVNVVGHPPFVSPWGGRDKRMQTNPFCCAIPTEGDPVILDMATSAIAYGKARVARMKGDQVPPGSLFDKEGSPSADPAVLEAGGSLAPFGMHKGYGLALICELLGGGLAGEWTMADVGKQKDMTVNHMLTFIVEPDIFGGVANFRREVEAMADWLHAADPAVGVDRVRLPGEPERESKAERLATGIPVDEQSWIGICDAARRAGVEEASIPS